MKKQDSNAETAASKIYEIPEPESGMQFSFLRDNFFPIETLRKDGHFGNMECFKPCEWIICPSSGKLANNIVFIEAKSSAPNHKTCVKGDIIHNGVPLDGNWKLHSPVDIYVQDICQKFIDSFSLWQAMHDGWHSDKNKLLPPNARKCSSKITPVFMLIISYKNEELLGQIYNVLEKEFKHFRKAWKMPTTCLKVLSPEMAHDMFNIRVERVPEQE